MFALRVVIDDPYFREAAFQRDKQLVYVGYARRLLAYAVDCGANSGLDCHIVSTSLHTAERIQRAKAQAKVNKFFQSRSLAMSV